MHDNNAEKFEPRDQPIRLLFLIRLLSPFERPQHHIILRFHEKNPFPKWPKLKDLSKQTIGAHNRSA